MRSHFENVMDKSFERAFSLNLNRLKLGRNDEEFSLNKDFLSHFALSIVQDCEVVAKLEIQKYASHLDVKFVIDGTVVVECDRCVEEMQLPVHNETRVLYSFDKNIKETEDVEVIYVDEKEPSLTLVQELYDFLCIAVPFRKVHEDIGTPCADFISKYIVNTQDEVEVEQDIEEEEEDFLD